jgi:hypothetical protein
MTGPEPHDDRDPTDGPDDLAATLPDRLAVLSAGIEGDSFTRADVARRVAELRRRRRAARLATAVAAALVLAVAGVATAAVRDRGDSTEVRSAGRPGTDDPVAVEWCRGARRVLDIKRLDFAAGMDAFEVAAAAERGEATEDEARASTMHLFEVAREQRRIFEEWMAGPAPAPIARRLRTLKSLSTDSIAAARYHGQDALSGATINRYMRRTCDVDFDIGAMIVRLGGLDGD